MGFGLEYQCNFHSRLIDFKGICPFHSPNFYILTPLFTRKDILWADVRANCVSGLRSRRSPCELTLAGMLQRHQRSLYLYRRLFLCALILKQSISFDIFQLIGIFLGILWEFQSRLKGFLKDVEMKLSYLIFPLQLLLRKLALCQENRTNNTRSHSWISNHTSDNVLCSAPFLHVLPKMIHVLFKRWHNQN